MSDRQVRKDEAGRLQLDIFALIARAPVADLRLILAFLQTRYEARAQGKKEKKP